MDETYRLNLEANGAEKAEGMARKVREVDQAVQVTTADIYEFAQSLQHVSGESYGFADGLGEVTQSAADLYRQARATTSAVQDMFSDAISRANMPVEKYLGTVIKVDQGVGRLKGAFETSKGGFRNFGQAAMEGSRALEDLQYGISGVVNNIPSLVMALGGTAGVAAAFSLAAIAVNQLVKHWDDVERLFSETSAMPKAADQTRSLNKELETATKRMQELEAAGEGTAAQIEEYNKLVAKTVELEAKLTEEKEKQKRLKEFDELGSPVEADEAKERAAILKDYLGGERKHNMMTAVAEASRRRHAQRAKEAAAYAESLEGRFDVSPEQLESARKEAAQWKRTAANTPQAFEVHANWAKDMLAKAMGGDKKAFDAIRQQMKAFPGAFTKEQQDAFELASPEFAAWENEWEQKNNRVIEAGKKREKDRKLVRALNEQGSEGQHLAAEQLKTNEAEDRAEDTKLRDDSKRRAQADRDELARGLGDEFLDTAADTLAGIGSMRGRKKVRAMDQFQARLQPMAHQQLLAAGVPEERVNELVPQVSGLVEARASQRAAQAGALGTMTGTPVAPPDIGAATQLVKASQELRQNDISGPLQQAMQMNMGAIQAQAQQNAMVVGALRQLGMAYSQLQSNFVTLQQSLTGRGVPGPWGGDYR
jgi:hypothetical protein